MPTPQILSGRRLGARSFTESMGIRTIACLRHRSTRLRASSPRVENLATSSNPRPSSAVRSTSSSSKTRAARDTPFDSKFASFIVRILRSWKGSLARLRRRARDTFGHDTRTMLMQCHAIVDGSGPGALNIYPRLSHSNRNIGPIYISGLSRLLGVRVDYWTDQFRAFIIWLWKRHPRTIAGSIRTLR